MKAALFGILAIALSGCAINIHPKGQCPTPGVSPLASNCPAAAQDR
ncbi:hypothetical protein WOC76_09555 [Methylocystis sp. IM3]|jgi:hypothetical protein